MTCWCRRIISTARGDCGLVTSAGRLIKICALDLPTVPATAHAPNLQGGTHVSELITLAADEKVLCLTTLTEDSLGLALGTAQGVVKRVNPGGPRQRRLGGDPAGAGRSGGRRR